MSLLLNSVYLYTGCKLCCAELPRTLFYAEITAFPNCLSYKILSLSEGANVQPCFVKMNKKINLQKNSVGNDLNSSDLKS